MNILIQPFLILLRSCLVFSKIPNDSVRRVVQYEMWQVRCACACNGTFILTLQLAALGPNPNPKEGRLFHKMCELYLFSSIKGAGIF